MKTLTKIGLLLLALCLLIAADLPPQMPSSFWGYVQGGKAGMVVTAEAGGVTLARTSLFTYNGRVVYSIDVPSEGNEGVKVNFRVNGFVAGSGVIRTGTNQQSDLIVRSFYYPFLRR